MTNQETTLVPKTDSAAFVGIIFFPEKQAATLVVAADNLNLVEYNTNNATVIALSSYVESGGKADSSGSPMGETYVRVRDIRRPLSPAELEAETKRLYEVYDKNFEHSTSWENISELEQNSWKLVAKAASERQLF